MNKLLVAAALALSMPLAAQDAAKPEVSIFSQGSFAVLASRSPKVKSRLAVKMWHQGGEKVWLIDQAVLDAAAAAERYQYGDYEISAVGLEMKNSVHGPDWTKPWAEAQDWVTMFGHTAQRMGYQPVASPTPLAAVEADLSYQLSKPARRAH